MRMMNDQYFWEVALVVVQTMLLLVPLWVVNAGVQPEKVIVRSILMSDLVVMVTAWVVLSKVILMEFVMSALAWILSSLIDLIVVLFA